ncbi:hypothetical protein AAZV13_13G012600 [Glycine max]
MSSAARSSLRASVSPLRSRKSPAGAVKPAGRPTTPSSSSTASRPSSSAASRPSSKASVSPVTTAAAPDVSKAKENVTVTVRFRPLSGREINKGDEVAWYADGDSIVRNEYNPSVAYGFDKVFGPATTTRHVYDVAAQHVVSGAMEGINGTVFAYGVTSSGKTHTMHGEQKSPGIIPLAVKDVFSIIQETPGREFLLRVSYLEIYNEVINDLLDPTGQNLRIREDVQGTYVEGIKEEVVLSPAHALSLIATGEEHRHVGSNNFNLVSSRSHTIFTLTVESSSRDENIGEEDVTLSHLHLIDLAGSESSKTETTGLRRKEGSYINKSLLTLGTVIAKLTDGKATHIPYRDSKLTRLLQSSLSGHGRISLICTVTPASSSSEETHNTLKFAHRSKHVEIKASQNKIMDEKSLIKKYQKEISELKQELQQLKRGMVENPNMAASSQEDLVTLKLQLEAGQSKLKSRLQEEEQAKAALMGRIQRLTKLILVSTKNAMSSSIAERPSHRRRHSFGEDELAYLPDRKRETWINDDTGSHASVPSPEEKDDITNLDELGKDYKRSKRQENVRLVEEKDGLEIQSQKLAEEASYAKELAAAAAVELRNLAEEVTKLTYENAELSGDLEAAKEASCNSNFSPTSSYDCKQNINNSFQRDGKSKKLGNEVLIEDLQKDLNARLQREAALEAALSVKVEIEDDLRSTLDEIKHQKQDLEYELTNMRMLVSKMKKSGINVEDKSTNDVQTKVKNGHPTSNGYSHRKQYKEGEILGSMEDMIALEELRANYQRERRRCKELESHISILKGEDIAGLDVMALEELQNLHIEAITKICHAKYANQNL